MLKQINKLGNWLVQISEEPAQEIEQPPVPLERPNISVLAQPGAELPLFVRESSVARKYLELLGPISWGDFPERDPHRAWPGPKPVPRACFAASYLVKIKEQKVYMSDLHEYLFDHPALIWILGFPLEPSDEFSWGFDPDASLPTARHFGRVLREMDNSALQFLLDATVNVISSELPDEVDFGNVVSCDTKHIIAWVRENNPKDYVEDRYNKDKQPKGDPDCRLGCKRKHNVGELHPETTSANETPPTPTTNPVPADTVEVGEYYWGYGSGVIEAKVPDWGEFVIAELTQPFNRSDVTYFFPLMRDTERRLGFRPGYAAFDAAFDAFYVYEHFYKKGKPNFAAVPLVLRGGIKREFDGDGLPLCKAKLPMPLKSTYFFRATLVPHERGRYACPLFYPEPSGDSCPIRHKNWKKGGCVVVMPTSIGARIRYQIDRESEDYKRVYKQRTATERANSRAVALGIERPKLRNGKSIANFNTLIYVVVNLNSIQLIRKRKMKRDAA